MARNFVYAPLQMSPEDGKAFNCWFPMPFKERALLPVNKRLPVDEEKLLWGLDF